MDLGFRPASGAAPQATCVRPFGAVLSSSEGRIGLASCRYRIVHQLVRNCTWKPPQGIENILLGDQNDILIRHFLDRRFSAKRIRAVARGTPRAGALLTPGEGSTHQSFTPTGLRNESPLPLRGSFPLGIPTRGLRVACPRLQPATPPALSCRWSQGDPVMICERFFMPSKLRNSWGKS